LGTVIIYQRFNLTLVTYPNDDYRVDSISSERDDCGYNSAVAAAWLAGSL
jgi:hypothetical protein